jgi:hypothetical protein
VRWADTEEDEDEWIDERDFNGTDKIADYWDAILPKRARPVKGVSADVTSGEERCEPFDTSQYCGNLFLVFNSCFVL